jgi:hypothetical protein
LFPDTIPSPAKRVRERENRRLFEFKPFSIFLMLNSNEIQFPLLWRGLGRGKVERVNSKGLRS